MTKALPDVMPFHDLCKQFDEMKGKEFDELVGDIKRRGLRIPIVTHKGQIIDGRNRARACAEAGVPPQYQEFDGADADVPRFILSMNVFRRHLKPEQRRAVLKQMLQTMPEKSDRQIAAVVQVSPTTVGTVRAELEKSGDVSKLDTSIDTKGRRQPRRKPARAKPESKAAQEVLGAVFDSAAEDLRDPKRGKATIKDITEAENDPANEIQRLTKKIIGLENQIEDMEDAIAELKKPRTIDELIDALVELLKREPGAQLGIKLKEITTKLQRVYEGNPDTPLLKAADEFELTKH